MKVAFGTTALSKGIVRNHIDGIGVTCASLLTQYETKKDIDVKPVSFNVNSGGRIKGEITYPGAFTLHAAYSIMSGLPFMFENSMCKSIDLFHAPDHYIPKLRNTPVIATIMDMIPFSHPEWMSSKLRRTKNYALKKSMSWADHIITISEYSKKDIIHYLGIDESKVSVIPLGFNNKLTLSVPDREKYKVLDKYGLGASYFIFIGTLQPRKNITRIIHAHKLLPVGIRKEFPLIIVGKDGWGTQEIKRDITTLEEESCGKWLDSVSDDDLQVLLQYSTGLIYPSLYEGFGLPILEGFAASIPVISSNTSSIPEVAGDAALLVNPLNLEEISCAMLKVIEDSDMVEKLILNGKRRLKQYSWERCANETINLYKKYS